LASKAVEEALARVVGSSRATQCWAAFLPDEGDVVDFLRGLEVLEDDQTVHVNRTEASRSFSDLGLEISDNMVGNHLRRKCGCRPKR
jgi:hypothetical protein